MNRRNYCSAIAVIAATLLAGTPTYAQELVVGAADPEALFTSPDRAPNANKQVMLHIVRDLLEVNHWSDAPKYISRRYIRHNPMVASGLEPVMKFFGSRTPGPLPRKSEWKAHVVSVVAEGDLVMVATVREPPRVGDPTNTYTTT